MKNVILYVRVSTDEQAGRGYSLRDQEEKLLNYCKNCNFNVIQIFREDYSAKTFKRPEFNKLLIYCKKNKKEIHQLLFIKWDRFSRNITESYNMLAVFNDLSIQLNAIEQPLDLSIPEQSLILAVYLSVPEVENFRRSLNVIGGMRRAFKEGRYVGNAPKGYSNGRDDSKKPLLIPNENAVYIQEAFELMATGYYNQMEVLTKLRVKGFNSSKTAFASILRNHLYYGGVYLKAYKEEQECIIDGIHEPIITKHLFDKVQRVLNSKSNKFQNKHKKINSNFPLRGFLLCPSCNKQLTASISKGRTKHYGYYHCTSPCNARYKLEDANYIVQDFLESLTLEKSVQNLFIEVVKERLLNDTNNNQLSPKHFENLKQIEDKIFKLQDKFIEGDITKFEYEQLKVRYENIQKELKLKETSRDEKLKALELYKSAVTKMEGICNLYKHAEIEDKRKLIGSIFPKYFQFENDKVRTKDINPIILKITSIYRASRGEKKEDRLKKMNLSCMVGDEGFEPPTLWV